MGGVIQVACCVTHHKQEDIDEDDEQAAVVERGLSLGLTPEASQKPLFERAESFATTIPTQKTNGHSSP